jgi:opacity protein-like surface antigen
MKKLLFIAASVAVMTQTANAQGVRFGVEGGFNMFTQTVKYPSTSGETVTTNDDFKPGAKAGVIADIGLGSSLSIQPGLFFNMKGTESNMTTTTTIAGTEYRSEQESNLSISYIELPVNVQYMFGMPGSGRFFIGAGPYIAAAIGGKHKYEYSTNLPGQSTTTVKREDALSMGDDPAEDDIERLDYGVNANIGYMLPAGAFVRGTFGLGLANIHPSGTQDMSRKNWGFGLSVGYMLGGR